jgi:hypothetical protein
MYWFKWFFVGVLFSFFLIMGVFYSHLGELHYSVKWIDDLYKVKDEQLAKLPNKVLVVSGSSALYSINARRLGDIFQKPVESYAMTIGLGLKYILNRSKKNLHAGDTVLMPLEYNLYDDVVAPDYILPLKVLSEPDYYYSLPFVEKIMIGLSVPIKYIIHNDFNEKPKINSLYSELYTQGSLDNHGVIKEELLRTLYDKFEVAKISFPQVKPTVMNKRSKELIGQYIKWCRSHDVEIIAIPMPVIASPYLSSQQGLKAKKSIIEFWAANNVPFLGDFKSFEFPKKSMFDNPYHVNVKGKIQYMDGLIKVLKGELFGDLIVKSPKGVNINLEETFTEKM